MKTDDFDFGLDWKAMPTDPAELRGKRRDSGRMIVLDRAAATIEHTIFPTISDRLQPGDLLVFNDSYMLSNTLSFRHGNESAHVIVYGQEPDGTSIVELRSSQSPRPGLTLTATDDSQLSCTLLSPEPNQLWRARFEPAGKLVGVLERRGWRSDETIPLNPAYWRTRPDAYRSVYARKPGSLEIPSAGLHFSTDVLRRLTDKGVEFAYVTLHVGATEILAVRQIDEDELEQHKVRPEYFEVGDEAAEQINRARAERRRIIAIGTTAMRTLESLAAHREPGAAFRVQAGWTELYIYPGFEFKIANGLLTNLHRPRSSHIVLTAAFAGKDLLMRGYAEILEMGGYEFDMFGDSMLIL
ncbi:S-adenosylmethionine tRNA ribosyltransferase [Burkholderia sp. ABCPW 14]|uniref:S-adenosylmethionine:tRNA ribosyltransferase-isomerase n=1 Tax=Burkholderia sp. ABCPW 14 TaxID=1637860 RepID=UPI000770C4B4|nr:S-adenosylmethionine:tRNA ribosyltransferase-isomerase [Burkholderia sp. ABCPW 14]KVD70610.1 S-adenosylmethionine tRNA ribosyltransferase [Burkholderia sp. ABCPW 14]